MKFLTRDDLSEALQKELEELEKTTEGEEWFNSPLYHLIIEFDDGSIMQFNWAKYIAVGHDDYFIVLTEHCGNYIISSKGVNCLRKTTSMRENNVVLSNYSYNG